VCTFELDRIGVACLTMCPRCAGSEVVPPVSVGTAVRLVAQHCEHLGVDLDEMAAILDGGWSMTPRPNSTRPRV
jgi:hypothetical protein